MILYAPHIHIITLFSQVLTGKLQDNCHAMNKVPDENPLGLESQP